LPTALGLDDVKGNTSEEVFEGGANANTVTRNFFHFVDFDDLVDSCREDGDCHGSHRVFVFEGEEVTVVRGIVQFQMVC
jgi:hypothetical protein